MTDMEEIGQVETNREDILSLLKQNGYRLTKQRKIIVDIIANEE